MGLRETENWNGTVADDFTPIDIDAESLQKHFAGKIKVAKDYHPPKSSVEVSPQFVLGAFVVFFLTVVIAYELLNPPQRTTSELPPPTPLEFESPSRQQNEEMKTAKSKTPDELLRSLEQMRETPDELLKGLEQIQETPDEFLKRLEKIQDLPRNGATRWYTSEERVAPLKITTSGKDHHLLKLVDAYSNRTRGRIFVRAGGAVAVDVPLGSYVLKYASGRTWYGYTHFFGEETKYSKAEEVFRFFETGDGYRGYTLTLYPVRYGNLETTEISPEEF